MQYQDGAVENINGRTFRRVSGRWVEEGGASAAPRPLISAPQDPAVAAKREQDMSLASRDQSLQEEANRRAEDALNLQRERFEYEKRNKPAPNQLPPATLATLKGQAQSISGFERQIDELESLYSQKLAGDKGSVLGLGGDRNIGGHLPYLLNPGAKVFDDKANSLIGAIAAAQGATGGEMNSLAEMKARFGPLIPSATDSDENIRIKLNGLRQMATGEKSKIAVQLGRPLTEDPRHTPSAPPEFTGAKSFESNGQRIFDPQSQEQTALSDGNGTQVINDPVFAGLNGRINGLLKNGAPMSEVAGYIRKAGIPLNQEITSQLRAIEVFRKKNPGYAGDYKVDLDDKIVPMSKARSTLADMSNSSLGAAGIAAGNAITGNRLDSLVGLGGGNAEQANAGMEMLRQQNPMASLAGDVAGGASLYGAGRAALRGLGASAPAWMSGRGGALAADGATGAYLGSGEGAGMLNLEGGVKGGILGAGAGQIARGAISVAGRAVSPTGGALAPVYAEGAQPTIGQRLGAAEGPFAGPIGRGINRAEQAFTSIPVLGGIQRSARNNAVEQAEAGAFNVALREVGAQLPKGVKSGTEAHTFMQDTFDRVYNKARSGMRFAPDGQFANDFGSVMQEADLLDSSSQQVFQTIAKRVGKRLQQRGGVLAGNDYKLFSSLIGKKVRSLRSNPNGDRELADVLDNLSSSIDGAARRQSPKEFGDLMDAADRGYAKAVVIEEASKRGSGGRFSGPALDQAVKKTSGGIRNRRYLRGQALMQEYAGAMRELGDTVSDSGTPERLAAGVGLGGGMGAAAQFVDPLLAAPYLANTLGNLPGVRQAVHGAIAPNRPGLAGARRRIIDRQYLGGLFGVPLLAE